MSENQELNKEPVETPEDGTTDSKELSADLIASMSDEDFEKNQDLIEQQLMEAHASINTESQSYSSPEETSSNEGTSVKSETTPEEDIENTGENPTEQEMTPEEFYKFLTSPFRANNANVQVDNPKDIRRLMQMGLNYQKKLGKIRPHLGALKSLEQNGLLDSEKLSFMIEVMQHKPEAIAQLLKDSNVDTYELPDLEETPYKPTTEIADVMEVEFDEQVAELNKTNEGRIVLSDLREWDETSKNEIYKNPVLLSNLEEQVSSGLYADTLAIIERERALGNIPPNTSMIEAYNTVATQLLETSDKYPKPSHWNEAKAFNKQANSNGATNMQNAQSSGYHPNAEVVGNNLQTQPMQVQQSAKYNASIPTNAAPSQSAGTVDLTSVITHLTDDELEQYGNFEDFLVKNNIRFK